jgi:hypothetical protein
MNRHERMQKIGRLCKAANCGEKLRKVHFSQFVYHDWHPHPPRAFVDWFARHPDNVGETGSGAVVFFNAARYFDQFREAREHGLLGEVPRSLQKIEGKHDDHG